MKFPWSLLKGKWIISSHVAWAKMILAAYLALIASKDGKVVITRSSRSPEVRMDLFNIIKENIVKDAILENILVGQKEEPTGTRLYIALEPYRLPKTNTENIIVFTTPGSGLRIPSGWSKIMLVKLTDNEFLMKSSEDSIRIVISTKYIGYAKELSGVYGDALALLREGIVEYGGLSVKDAVELIMYNLGVKKDKAREILGYLVRKGYVKIHKKEVIVL